MKFFLDTNACVAYLRGTSPPLRRALTSQPFSQIQIPAVVEAELLFGARKSQRVAENLHAVRTLLKSLVIVPFGSAAADQYSHIRSELEADGRIIGPNDLLIAATVMAEGGTLVTHNTDEFSRVRGLHLEDWQS